MNMQKRKVIVVDDSEPIGKVIRTYLPESEFDVCQALNGQEALRLMSRQAFDLIVLDVNMPGMGGLEFLKRISANGNGVLGRVLVLTARGAMSGFFETLDVAGFLPKPCSRDEFVSKVRQILGQGVDARSQELHEAGGWRVLCADGDVDVLARIDRALKAVGYSPVIASSGPAALEMAAVIRPSIILLRETLPGLNGSALASLLHTMPGSCAIPIVLYDDSMTPDDRRRLERRIGDNVKAVVASSTPGALLQELQALNPLASQAALQVA